MFIMWFINIKIKVAPKAPIFFYIKKTNQKVHS